MSQDDWHRQDRKAIEAEVSLKEIEDSWVEGLTKLTEMRNQFLLYSLLRLKEATNYR